MKIICLLLLTIINAQLAHGTLYAAPPKPSTKSNGFRERAEGS